MKGLAIGRIIHYVDANWEHIAGIVTKVYDKDKGWIGVVIFPYGVWSLTVGEYENSGVWNGISALYSATFEQNTWHFPEYVE